VSEAFAPLDVAVVGGGISGLTCAFYLKQAGKDVTVFEAQDAVGGCIRSITAHECIADGGPQSFTLSPELARLIREAGVEGAVLAPPAGGLRPYLFVNGRLIAVPTSPAQMLTTPMLSARGKLRALADLVLPRHSPDGEETVAAFVRRRAGQEVLARIVTPYVGGIFAGDPEALSVEAAFPGLVELERKHGSIIRGVLASRRRGHAPAQAGRAVEKNGADRPGPGRRAGTFAFRGGNDLLPRALAERLGTAIRLGAKVEAMWQRGAWMELAVEASQGRERRRVVARRIVIATPAAQTAALLESLEPAAAQALRSIPSPPVVQVALAYPRDAAGVPLDGFGFLAARSEGVRILGCVWNSAMFADRSPADRVLLTAFLGGALDPAIMDDDDDEIVRTAHRDLKRVLKIRDVAPVVVGGFRWQEAIPQSTPGHAARLATIERCLRGLPQVRLCGNYLGNPSVAACVERAAALAATLVQ
jgi:oxygen-dependent protoporphyrinogen oxidase